MEISSKKLYTDLLIIGGGITGCYAGITIAKESNAKVVIAEKVHIKHNKNIIGDIDSRKEILTETNKSSEEYDIQEDLNFAISHGIDKVKKHLAELLLNGKEVVKEESGDLSLQSEQYKKENMKAILVSTVYRNKQIKVINSIHIVDYILKDKKVIGAYGFDFSKNILYAIYAKAVICATGGVLRDVKKEDLFYLDNKMIYNLTNISTGYAMGIRSGAKTCIMSGGKTFGYLIKSNRETTLRGLFAAGGVAGGCPRKYLIGGLVEAKIAAISSLDYIEDKDQETIDDKKLIKKFKEITNFLRNKASKQTLSEIQIIILKEMKDFFDDNSVDITHSESDVDDLLFRIARIHNTVFKLNAKDLYAVMKIYELLDCILLIKTLLSYYKKNLEERNQATNEKPLLH